MPAPLLEAAAHFAIEIGLELVAGMAKPKTWAVILSVIAVLTLTYLFFYRSGAAAH